MVLSIAIHWTVQHSAVEFVFVVRPFCFSMSKRSQSNAGLLTHFFQPKAKAPAASKPAQPSQASRNHDPSNVLLKSLAKLVVSHDVELRQISADTYTTFVLPVASSLGEQLENVMKEWKSHLPSGGGANPMGSPRDALGIALLNWIAESYDALDEDSQRKLEQTHQIAQNLEYFGEIVTEMKSQQSIEPVSHIFSFCSFQRAKSGVGILKIRAKIGETLGHRFWADTRMHGMEIATIWESIVVILADYKSEGKKPKGPLVREVETALKQM